MSVVLRCPTCGTTRPGPGDCEACHEAQVRYFCTNHTPGRWVDAPTCPQCGARFGEARRAPVPVPVPAEWTRPRAPTRAPAPTTPPPPPYLRVETPGIALGTSPMAILLNLLTGAARAGRPAPVPERARPGLARGLFGCLIQLVLGFFTLLSALFLFG